jgi:hypothetical protein
MTGTATIELSLPRGTELTERERALLEGAVQALVGLRREGGEHWEDRVRRLEAAGWEVHSRLAWVAEARRRNCHEQCVGRTLDEAFDELWGLALFDAVEGCP